jgi:hypothetical protein
VSRPARFDIGDRDATLLFGLEVAMCLYAGGRFNEAEIPFAEALETSKMVLGAEHPDTLISINNLASTLDKGCVAESSSIDARIISPSHTWGSLFWTPS